MPEHVRRREEAASSTQASVAGVAPPALAEAGKEDDHESRLREAEQRGLGAKDEVSKFGRLFLARSREAEAEQAAKTITPAAASLLASMRAELGGNKN